MTVPVAGRGPQVAGVAGLFLALSTIAIVLRCYCRAVVVKSFGIDDWSALIAWILFVFFCTFAIAGVHHGTGQHSYNLPPAEIPVGLKWWWACEPVYVLSNMALKLSIGVMLLRIAVSRIHKIIIWTTVVILELYSLGFFLLFVMQCLPSEYFWTRFTGGSGSCINPDITVNATYAYSAISCAADWTLGLLPITLVWNLQMNPRTKLSVAAILALGAIASTATIVRFPYIKGLSNSADFLYATTDVAIWSTCETGIGIVASSIATLRPLFRTFFSRSRLLGGSTSQGGTNPWPASGNGYIRSRNGAEEFGLRSDIGKSRGVTTLVEAGGDVEMGEGKVRRSMSERRESVGPLTSGQNGWNNSETKLTDISSEDGQSWPMGGIRKTTVTQNVVET
ncbi:hypothetical protein NA56DRAFT_701730 [Hyaloscypha hepaticicola]|uniref:Rhodopsin domain-containing protein n=1 Tax=Hyaloscypha hepaticicola TaxID=2082293 RepID=A0A2J6QB00_9HELO|nr:hypothetical protein NA56DRAFT_701730 [Hyaloscypha hepaticicola]